MRESRSGVPIEEFIQALTSQLDRAQRAMALKADTMDLPLTFAVKDLSLDLRTHVDVVQSVVQIRPAAAGESEASMLHLSLTTITKPMIQENARPLDIDDRDSLKDADLSTEEQNRLEWAGIHTVDQLRRVTEARGGDVERVANLPIDRLKRALMRASLPQLGHVEPYLQGQALAENAAPMLRVSGRNFTRSGSPTVSISGQPASVVKLADDELIVAPRSDQLAGVLSVESRDGGRAETEFDLTHHFKPPASAAAVEGVAT